MRTLRSWFTEDRASDVPQDYTAQILAAQLAAARSLGGVKSTAAYRGALSLIGHSAGVATLSGLHSEALEGNLSTVAREMVDTGQSDWLINIGPAGEVVLLPVTAAAVTGGPDPRSWIYTLTMPGPSQTVTLQRSGESILSFRLRVDSRTPWYGKPAIDSSGTGELLCELEAQMRDEAKVTPARVIAGGAAADQAVDISELVGAGGIVGITQAVGSLEDPSGIRAGIVRNESTSATVTLHQQLQTAILGAMGVPADLVMGSSSESGSRESFRRLASTTINNILTTISREWIEKMGTELQWDLSQLRSSDEVSRARAVGSRAQAVSRLVDSGLPLDQAMAVVGID